VGRQADLVRLKALCGRHRESRSDLLAVDVIVATQDEVGFVPVTTLAENSHKRFDAR